MKDRLISTRKTRLVRLEVVNSDVNVQVSSEVNPLIYLSAPILSSKQLIMAGCL